MAREEDGKTGRDPEGLLLHGKDFKLENMRDF